MNHGRRYYKKLERIPGHEEVDVYLYFWDERDGPSFNGWWFGSEVGGAQVWARNEQLPTSPPKSGWRIPWDGAVKQELVVMSMQERREMDVVQGMQAKEEQYSQELSAAEWDKRVTQATSKAAEAELDTTPLLEEAQQAMQGDADDAVVKPVLAKLMTQSTHLAETQRFLTMEGLAAQKAPPELKEEMTALGHRVKRLQERVKEEATRLQNAKAIKAKELRDEEKRVEEEMRERELEGQHQQQLEEMMPGAMEKVDMADDEVEKVAIAAAPLQIDTGDDLRAMMLETIKDTEQRVRAAQAAIGEARRFITGKLTQVQHFVASTKKTAVEEFTNMQEKLNE